MRSLVRAPFVAVKRTLTVPSSRRRGWYCSAAARLQPPVDERPARTAPGLVRPYLSRTRARRRGRARRSPAPRGRRGASFFYADREHGRARRARWAARIPRTPALGTCSHAPLSTSPPTTLRTADRSGVRARSRERGALVQRHLAPLADPRRRVGLRARVCYAREDGWRSRAWPSDGCARWVRPSAPAALARCSLELDPPRLDSAWAPSLLGAWGRPFPAARRIP